MMLRWLICLLLAASVVHADPIPRRAFTGTAIQPLGKGIVGKKSNESLVLVCAEQSQNCSELQFLYAKSPKEVYQVGPRFKTPATEKELKRILKQLAKNARNPNQIFFFLLAEVVILVVATPILDSATPAMLAIFLPLTIGMTGMHDLVDLQDDYENIRSVDFGSVTLAQDGWNWNESARHIGEKRFQRILKYIENTKGFSDFLRQAQIEQILP